MGAVENHPAACSPCDITSRAHSAKSSSYRHDVVSDGVASAVRPMSPPRFLSYHAVQRCDSTMMGSRRDHEYSILCCLFDPCAERTGSNSRSSTNRHSQSACCCSADGFRLARRLQADAAIRSGSLVPRQAGLQQGQDLKSNLQRSAVCRGLPICCQASEPDLEAGGQQIRYADHHQMGRAVEASGRRCANILLDARHAGEGHRGSEAQQAPRAPVWCRRRGLSRDFGL
jgi:hypothetical protein